MSSFTSRFTTLCPQKHHFYEPFFAKTLAKTTKPLQKFFLQLLPVSSLGSMLPKVMPVQESLANTFRMSL
jgi:hypothetical protein